MIRQILISLFLCFGLAVVAQEDPVLMHVNGREVHRSEFEHFYRRDKNLAGAEKKTLKEYADFFANYKLKIAAAERAKMDTSRAFRTKLQDFRNQQVQAYLTDGEATERKARQFYNQMKTNQRVGKVLVSHIYKAIPQTITRNGLRQVEASMDSIYGALQKDATAASFDACVKRFSDDKNSFWVNWLQMPTEFEEVVFGLQVGEVSRPFFTPQGLHIVKVLEKKGLPFFEEVKDEIIRNQTRHHAVDKGTKAWIEKLKSKYHYALDKAAWGELLAKGKTTRTLFTLNDKVYTGSDFARFATAHPEGVERQFAGFVMKSVLDYGNEHLEQEEPELRLLLQEYRDSLLLHQIMNYEVKERAQTDTVGLKDYFEEHHSNYYWKEPRYKGIVLHCTTKRVSKRVRKFLRELPENEWKDGVRFTFNATATPKVQMEQGVFAPKENQYVDDLVFKMKKSSPVLSFPFTVVLGKKLKGPEDYKEVGEQLIFDYQNHLEQRWLTKLRAAGKVEINQEVLKTVNNH